MTDLLMEHSFGRAEAFFNGMLDAARTGCIDPHGADADIDPVLFALREGGLRHWLEHVYAHDDTTVRQCLRVAGLVANFAVYLGLSSHDRATLVRAGLLHDVGKARIPLAILNKPGPLAADEMTTMRTRPAVGHDFLKASGIIDPVALAATLHRHQMLDGSGYPDVLRGHEIGDSVRLLTICETYAALIERRPYRAALPHSKGLPIRRRMAPNKLEATLKEAFAASLA